MGSKLGWIAALGIVVIVALVAYRLFNPPPSNPVDTTAEGFLELKDTGIPLSTVIGVEPAEPGNAADDYQKASQLRMNHDAEIDTFSKEFDALVKREDPWTDPGVKVLKEIHDHVAAGARKKKMEYTFVYTDSRFHFAYHSPGAERLWKVAVAVNQLYLFRDRRKEHAEAEKALKNLLILGHHMLNERRVAHMEQEGLEVQMAAVRGLLSLYGKGKVANVPGHRVGALEKYAAALERISANFRKKKQILWDYIPASDHLGRPRIAPGDVFNIAEHDEDRAWRVQAVITLGALKHRLTDRGDLRKTRELIRRFLQSKDPLLSAAAEAADKLTAEQFRHSNDDF